MLRLINLWGFIICGSLLTSAQNISFFPEVLLGNRSAAYQHYIGYRLNDSWSFNNISLFDSEYTNNQNNIFFIRTMLSYNLNKNFKVNTAIGIKNPGTFATITSQYLYTSQRLKLSYALGSTYQNGFTLEQTLLLNYTPVLRKNIQGYINLFAVLNTNFKVLDRSIQQLRVGIKKERLITGLAVNLDQFTRAKKTLENFGIFIKYNF